MNSSASLVAVLSGDIGNQTLLLNTDGVLIQFTSDSVEETNGFSIDYGYILPYLYHCSQSGGCSQDDTPLSVDSDLVYNNHVMTRWSGWSSSLGDISGKILLYSMTVAAGTLKEDGAAVAQWNTSGLTNRMNLSIPNLPLGIYAVVLKLTNDANQSCARKLIMVDQNRALILVNTSNLIVSSALKEADYPWIRVSQAGHTLVQVSLENAVSFKSDQLQSWVSAPVSPHWCTDKILKSNLDDQSVLLSLNKWLSQKGVSNLEYYDEVTQDEGRDFKSRGSEGNLSNFTFYNESSRILNLMALLRAGDTYVIAIRLWDSYDRNYLLQTACHAVSVAPNMSDPQIVDSFIHADKNDTCQIRIRIHAADAIAGIETLDWTLYASRSFMDYGRSTLDAGHLLKADDDRSQLTAQFCFHKDTCFCPTTTSGELTSMGCFQREYTVPVVIHNCVAEKSLQQIWIRFSVVSYAGLEQTTSLCVFCHTEKGGSVQQAPLAGRVLVGVILFPLLINVRT